MSFTNALNKAIELAFDKKENVDPKDPANWFTMNGTQVLDDGDDRAESATSFIKRKTEERAQKKTQKAVETSAEYVREQIAKNYHAGEPFTTDYDGGREYSSYGWWDIDRGAD